MPSSLGHVKTIRIMSRRGHMSTQKLCWQPHQTHLPFRLDARARLSLPVVVSDALAVNVAIKHAARGGSS